jgi:hypothetical protein
MNIKIGNLELREWTFDQPNIFNERCWYDWSRRKLVKGAGDYFSSNRILLNQLRWKSDTKWSICFMGSCNFLQEHYLSFYGTRSSELEMSLQEAKDRIDKFLIKMSNLSVFI